MTKYLSLPRLALLPRDYYSLKTIWIAPFLPFVFFPFYTGEVFSNSGACMGDTSQRRCHLGGRVSSPGGGWIPVFLRTFHASRLSSKLGRQDVLSNPAQPTDPPAGRHVAGSLCQVSLQVCLLLPGRAPRQAVFLFSSHVAPGSLDVFEGGPHFHRS